VRSAVTIPRPAAQRDIPCSSKARVGISIQDDETAEKRGEGWRGSIRNHFTTRISSNAVSIFPNKV
jgi:hypothetical protein